MNLIEQYNPRQLRVWPPEPDDWRDDPRDVDEILDEVEVEDDD